MSKIEEVAKALCKRHYTKRFGKSPSDAHVVMNVEANWRDFAEEAQVAIEAMREPNEDMLDAMNEHAGSIAPEYAWADAIDAALKDPAQ